MARMLCSHLTHLFSLALTAEEQRGCASSRPRDVCWARTTRSPSTSRGDFWAGRSMPRSNGRASGCWRQLLGPNCLTCGKVVPNGAAFSVAVRSEDVGGDGSVEANADGGEFREATLVAGSGDEAGGGVVVGLGLAAERRVAGRCKLGENQARKFEVIADEVQAHFAPIGDIECLGEVGGSCAEISQPAAEGGTGEKAARQVVIPPSAAQTAHGGIEIALR